jgi:stearoyl-CoA desaturase (delta-9 desaturase)
MTEAGALYGLSPAAQRVHVISIIALPAAGTAATVATAFSTGIAPFEWVMLGVGYVLTAAGVEVGFHRLFSHAAFEARPTLRYALAILGSTAAQGPAVYWAALHRHHHANSDMPGDPHSPHTSSSRLRGFWHAHIGWMFAPPPADLFEYVPEMFGDRPLVRIDRRYFVWLLLGLVVPAVLGGLGWGGWHGALRGFLIGGLTRIFLVQHGIWSINSVCHLLGREPFSSRDRSRNVAWLALPTLGGSLHNAHHAFPFTAKNAFGAFELDPGFGLIRLFERLGWASKVRVPSAEVLARARRTSPMVEREANAPDP